jgi:hypothetical protein
MLQSGKRPNRRSKTQGVQAKGQLQCSGVVEVHLLHSWRQFLAFWGCDGVSRGVGLPCAIYPRDFAPSLSAFPAE